MTWEACEHWYLTGTLEVTTTPPTMKSEMNEPKARTHWDDPGKAASNRHPGGAGQGAASTDHAPGPLVAEAREGTGTRTVTPMVAELLGETHAAGGP